MKCLICDEEVTNNNLLSRHLKLFHKEISKEEYYLLYMKKPKGYCETCGKETKFLNIGKGYRNCCSHKCATINPKNVIKREETLLRNYGVKYPLQNDIVKEKLKATNIKRYGVEYNLQSKEIKQKIKLTNLEKYGVEISSQAEEVKEKRRKKNLL
ncbi:MAG: hypothetical protein HUJ61_05550, partial [Bacilli bacterium]|nr:hypothetical protein [Bacilli bacterium]